MKYNIKKRNNSITGEWKFMNLRDCTFTYLRFGTYHFRDGQRCYLNVPRPFEIITKILSGSVVFRCGEDFVEAKEGETVYLPIGCTYEMTWHGASPSNTAMHYRLNATHRGRRLRKLEGVSIPLDETRNGLFDDLTVAYRTLALTEPLQNDAPPVPPNRVKRAVDFIRAHYAEQLPTQLLAEKLNLSPSRFFAVFREAMGMTAIEYRNIIRTDVAMQLLLTTDQSVEAISEEVGFSSAVHFRRIFKKITGTNCREYRRANASFL